MEESQKLLQEVIWFQKAKEEADIRQKAEKAHLAVTLASDALIVHRGYPKPASLYRRKDFLSRNRSRNRRSVLDVCG
jgi:hypothetical protein